MNAIQINASDNVEVLLKPRGNIPAGHKLARCDIRAGGKIVKYGFPVGIAIQDIKAGEWVHTHNVRSALNGDAEFSYEPVAAAAAKPLPPGFPLSFSGYPRPNGRVGIRNEIWIIPTVGCVNSVAEKLAGGHQSLVGGAVEGLYAFTHPYGCSQTGAGTGMTAKACMKTGR